jgi:hypothetical protein
MSLALARVTELAVFFTQDKLDEDGYPVRDRDSSTSPPSSPQLCSRTSCRLRALYRMRRAMLRPLISRDMRSARSATLAAGTRSRVPDAMSR